MLFLLGLGAIVSLQHSWLPGFFHDGYLYASFGKNAVEKGRWLVPSLSPYSYENFEQHLPTTFILEGLFFKLLGANYVTARMFSSFFFLLTGLLIFLWVKKNTKERPLAYYALFFFFTMPPLLKKVRFPNIDFPLMMAVFLGFCFYTEALKTQKTKDWCLTGLAFGLCLLLKGPLGLLFPVALGSHLLWGRHFDLLLKGKVWLGFMLGFLIFSLWPISLYLSGQKAIFFDWYKFTFVETINKSRGVSEPFYTYGVFLLKHCSLWFGLFIWGIYKGRLKKENKVFDLVLVFFFAQFILVSLPKFKLSHYLIPSYPFLAIGAAYGVKGLGNRVYHNVFKSFPWVACLAGLVLLIFPLTHESRRDREIHQLKSFLKTAPATFNHWYNVNGCYMGGALTAINVWEGDPPVSMPSLKMILNFAPDDFKNKLVFVDDNGSELLRKKFENLKTLAILKKLKIVVLADRDTLFISHPLEYKGR